jgi:hypothetical protein
VKPDSLSHQLYRCATEDPAAALVCWETIAEEIRFDQMEDHERRLLPAVWKNLAPSFPDFPARAQLGSLYRYTWARNVQQQRCCEKVVLRLSEASVPSLVLKGIALNGTLYEDMGVRPAHDFDLLVQYEQAELALDVLARDGWCRKESEERDSPNLRISHAATLRKDDFELDLHWFALREARAPHYDHVLWERAVELTLGKTKARTLSPEHQLAHLIVNGTREPENSYRFLLDLRLFILKFRDHLNIEEVQRFLAERRVLSRLTYLPLAEFGYQDLAPQAQPSLLDRCWSWCSRNVNDGSGELEFGLYPFMDYWLHYSGRSDRSLTLREYLKHQLCIESWADFWRRLWGKLWRVVTSRARN